MPDRDLSYIKVTQAGKGQQKSLVTRCAECRHIGTLEQVGTDVEVSQHYFAGLRACPNPGCRALMTVRYTIYGDLLVTPSPVIPFDSQKIPHGVLRVFREAVQCHASKCYVASAIMVRRTLEEICSERGAVGKTLFKRIEDLGTRIVLPQELKDALHELRLLGNDAAHVEASTFAKVDEEEVLVAIEFTKEILKATYQYADLLQRMRNLKRNAAEETTQGEQGVDPNA